jgi:hypothetical protein
MNDITIFTAMEQAAFLCMVALVVGCVRKQ